MNHQPKNPIDDTQETKKNDTKGLELGFEDTHKPHESLENIKRTAEQNAQARLLLIQLQWLIILLMIGGILWLADTQKKLELKTHERLKVLEEFTARMNHLDDRIFAMTPSTQKDNGNNTAQNDLQLTKIQLASSDRLYHNGDYKDALEMLQALQFQLIQDQLDLAAPIKSALKSAVDEDIKTIEALTRQTDAWQTNMAKMREIQAFLRSEEKKDHSDAQRISISQANMLLSLALGAASIKDRDTTVVYLGETLARLETLKEKSPAQEKDKKAGTDQEIKSIEQAIFALNELLANPPVLTPLSSTRILK